MLRIQKKTAKIVALLTLNLILLSMILPNISFAATYTQTVKSGISNFPASYQSALKELQKEHPNWHFDAYYTGVDWNTFINSQLCSACKGRSLIHNSVDSSWKCSCGYSAAGYVCASKGIIEYYADPRNFLNEVNIFQFSEYTYNKNVHNLEGVKKSVKGTFLDDDVTFTINGKKKTMSYAEIIMKAAEESGMSPYSIRAKIIQEVGTKGSGSVSGKYKGYEGYYNFYNYGAYDNAAIGAVASGLKFAKEKGWDNQYTAIVEGAKLLANSYTLAGQNTAYFYKWDVVGTSVLTAGKTQKVDSSKMFAHQYMTNIQDPYGQSNSLWNMYYKAGILDEKINFIIPVYDNMPGTVSTPSSLDNSGKDLYYADVNTTLNVRAKASTSSSVVASISRNTKVAMLNRKYTTADGFSWDKIQLADGTVGYAATMYLSPVETPKPQNTEVAVTGISLDQANLSLEVGNGASINKATLKATINPSNATNKSVTWTSSNTKVATVSSGTVTAVGEGETTITAKSNNGKTATCKVKVTNVEKTAYKKAIINADALNVRKEASTSAQALVAVYENDWVKVIEENTKKDDKYSWAKIQTKGGVVGYVAMEFLNILDDIKIDEEKAQILVTPDMLAQDVIGSDENVTITDKDGKEVAKNALIGTGFKVKNTETGTEYVVVKKGDPSGDGKVNSADLLKIVKHLKNTSVLNNEYIEAADSNNDGKVNSADLLKIVKQLKGTSLIDI